MLIHLTVFLVGFTIFSAVSLIVAYFFFLPDLQKNKTSKLACFALLFGLVGLQWCHYLTLTTSFIALDNRFYLFCLLFVPACFYYFSRYVLNPSIEAKARDLLHLLPTLIGFFIPPKQVPPIAFLIGSAYCLWFVHLVLKLRTQKSRFNLERFFFGLFAVLAVVSLVLGLMLPYIESNIFYLAYGSSIGVAMLLVTTAIMVFPEMLSDIQQVVEIAYSKSKLKGVDIDDKKTQLEALIQQESIYQDESLNLRHMAELMEISGHQLSELVNTQYGLGFSKFIRTHRIEHAKKLLLDEPKASILAVSIMTGFKSQSNFYAAFREITSESPGNYRKRLLKQ